MRYGILKITPIISSIETDTNTNNATLILLIPKTLIPSRQDTFFC